MLEIVAFNIGGGNAVSYKRSILPLLFTALFYDKISNELIDIIYCFDIVII